MAKAYAAWPRVMRAEDPVAYVHGILTKSFLSERRRRSSSELPVAQTPDRTTTDPDPAGRLALLTALRTLGEVDRAVVVLRYWEDRSVAETAVLLNLTRSAVKNRCLRALAHLRNDLRDPAALSETTKGNPA